VKALLLAGTTEGRILAHAFADAGIAAVASVATEYGQALLGGLGPSVTLHRGRLDEEGMFGLIEREAITHVLDASHPYAFEASRNARAAASRAGAVYLRIARGESAAGEGLSFDSNEEAAAYLSGAEGNIFLSIGSKGLAAYTAIEGFESRITARMLPSVESLSAALALGYRPEKLILMQGPFSEEMNAASLKAADAAFLVTKSSGDAGGFGEKARAAARVGAKLIVIKRPEGSQSDGEGLSLDAAMELFGLRAPEGEVLETSEEAPEGEVPEGKESRHAPKAMFPFFLDVSQMKALLVGGGEVSARRAGTLSAFRCGITILSPQLSESAKELVEAGKAGWLERPYRRGDCAGYEIVLACTDDAAVNAAVAEEAKKAGCPFVGNASDAAGSTFFFPAIAHYGQVSVGIASDGGSANHRLVRKAASAIREALKTKL